MNIRVKPPEYSIWKGIRARCYGKTTPGYKFYGARNIRMCDGWHKSFDSFYADMGPRPSKHHSIERKDNDGNYSKDNCYWATRSEQANNRRSNINVTLGAETHTLMEWCRILGISYSKAWHRHENGKTGWELFNDRPQKLITCLGITDSLAGWSRRTGIRNTTIINRVRKYKWPLEKALTTPTEWR